MNRDMTRLDFAELRAIVADEPYPLAFATVSGAHLYGFPSRDSDVEAADSTLPDRRTAEAALHDLIVRTRLAP